MLMSTIWQEAVERLQGNDFLQLGMDADGVRQRLWPERVVTYTVGQRLNLGNASTLFAEAEAATERGAHGFVLEAAPNAKLDEVAHSLSQLHTRFPDVVLTGFSTQSITSLAAGDSVINVLEKLFDAGLGALGSNIPTHNEDASLSIHREAHAIGFAQHRRYFSA